MQQHSRYSLKGCSGRPQLALTSRNFCVRVRTSVESACVCARVHVCVCACVCACRRHLDAGDNVAAMLLERRVQFRNQMVQRIDARNDL